MATLLLTVGLPGAGKTTAARRVEVERPALRLTADEWLLRLQDGSLEHPSAQARAAVEALQWDVALRVLRLGCDVVLDWGLWSRQERDAVRGSALAAGADVVLLYDEVPYQVLVRRLSARDGSDRTFPVSEAQLAEYAELFEPPGPDEPVLSADGRS